MVRPSILPGKARHRRAACSVRWTWLRGWLKARGPEPRSHSHLEIRFRTQESTEPLSTTRPWISSAGLKYTKLMFSSPGVPLVYVTLPVQSELTTALPDTFASGITTWPPILITVEPVQLPSASPVLVPTCIIGTNGAPGARDVQPEQVTR